VTVRKKVLQQQQKATEAIAKKSKTKLQQFVMDFLVVIAQILP